MDVASKASFTQMKATVGFRLVGEKAVAAMVKKLKQMKYVPKPGKHLVREMDPDTLSGDKKKIT